MRTKRKLRSRKPTSLRRRRALVCGMGVGGSLEGVRYGRQRWLNPTARWLNHAQMRRWEVEAKQRGIAKVARSPRGFLTAFKRAKYDPRRLPERWHRKRAAFIKRHLAQARKNREDLLDWRKDGKPPRRLVALRIWAYGGV